MTAVDSTAKRKKDRYDFDTIEDHRKTRVDNERSLYFLGTQACLLIIHNETKSAAVFFFSLVANITLFLLSINHLPPV